MVGKQTHNAKVHTIYPKLEELRWFLMTVQYGNTRIAADKLGIKNYAIIPNSNRRIEQVVGAKLLNRNNTLTDAGRVFARCARRVLASHKTMMKSTRKAESQAALPPATVHVENWLLHKLNLYSVLPYEIREVVGYDEAMELYEATRKPGRRGVFLITNSNAVPNLTGRLAAVKLFEYQLRLYTLDKVGYPSIRWMNTGCFGVDLRKALPLGQCFHEVGEVPNCLAMRYALLGNPGLCGHLPAEWAEGLTELFCEKVPLVVPIWLLSDVE